MSISLSIICNSEAHSVCFVQLATLSDDMSLRIWRPDPRERGTENPDILGFAYSASAGEKMKEAFCFGFCCCFFKRHSWVTHTVYKSSVFLWNG